MSYNVRKYNGNSRKSNRYSIERVILNVCGVDPHFNYDPEDPSSKPPEGNLPTVNYSLPIINPSTIQGLRKVKNLTITFTSTTQSLYFYALIYVPQGQNLSLITLPDSGYAEDVYPANQYVLSSGWLSFTGGPCRIFTPLARNLNSGDTIHLVLATPNAPDDEMVFAEVQYAICFL